MENGGRRVVITGIGVVGPTGLGVEAFWRAVMDGPPAIGPVARFETTTYPCRIAGEVRDLRYRDSVPPAKLRTSSLASQFALAALELALRDARLELDRHYEPHRRGVSIGTSLAGWHEALQQHAILLDKGAARVNPFVLTSIPCYAAGVEMAAQIKAEGAHATWSTGCCAATNAIGNGADLVRGGIVDCCLAGGSEAPITPIVMAAMGRTRELSCMNDDPLHASRPFDKDHQGFVLSEGGAILVLESLDRARARGATIYAEVLGHGSTADATDPLRVNQDGTAGARAIHEALRVSGMAPSDVDYVCANGNSSPHFDRKETIVLKKALGEFAARVPVSSIKGVIGHPFGAAGAFVTAAAALAIARGAIPPTHNLVEPDPECDLDFVPGCPRQAALRHVLVCSYGFGGLNACLALRGIDVAS